MSPTLTTTTISYGGIVTIEELRIQYDLPYYYTDEEVIGHMVKLSEEEEKHESNIHTCDTSNMSLVQRQEKSSANDNEFTYAYEQTDESEDSYSDEDLADTEMEFELTTLYKSLFLVLNKIESAVNIPVMTRYELTILTKACLDRTRDVALSSGEFDESDVHRIKEDGRLKASTEDQS